MTESTAIALITLYGLRCFDEWLENDFFNGDFNEFTILSPTHQEQKALKQIKNDFIDINHNPINDILSEKVQLYSVSKLHQKHNELNIKLQEAQKEIKKLEQQLYATQDYDRCMFSRGKYS